MTPLPFDPPAAARLLDEAGWRDTDGNGTRDAKDGKPFEFDLLVSEGSEVGRQIDEMLAAELARVGVVARVRTLEWATFVEKVDAGDFDGGVAGVVRRGPQPRSVLLLALVAVRAAGTQRRLLPEPGGRPADGGGAPRERTRCAATPIYHRLHRIFRDDAPSIFVVNADAEVRLRQARPRPHDLAARPSSSGRGRSRGGRGPRGRREAGVVIRYMLRRLLLAVPTLFGIAVVVFLLLHLAPGSPGLGGADSLRRTSGRAAEEMRRLYGLDRPLPERFG